MFTSLVTEERMEAGRTDKQTTGSKHYASTWQFGLTEAWKPEY